MGGAIFNIVIGVLCIAGGLSGKFSLIGTQSSTALVVAGGVACGLGIWQFFKNRPR